MISYHNSNILKLTCSSHFHISLTWTDSLCLQMSDIVEVSQSSTQELQEQIDIYKEKNRRELADLQRQLKERGQELDKSRLAAKTLQEQVNYLSLVYNIMGAHAETRCGFEYCHCSHGESGQSTAISSQALQTHRW